MTLRTNNAQFLVMVEFMEKYGDISKPQSLPHGRQWCMQKWRQLSEMLNNHGIAESRSEEKWRKVWSDLKNNTKRKWAKMNRLMKGTGGGPALKIYLTDIESRVLAIIGVQAAVGMPFAEVGFGLMEAEAVGAEKIDSVPGEPQTDNLLITKLDTHIVGDEDWNTPGSHKDPGPIPPMPRSITPPPNHKPTTPPPKSTTPPPKSTTPPMSQMSHPPQSSVKSPVTQYSQTLPQLPPQRHQRKRKFGKTILAEYVEKCDANAREDNRERERLFVDLERERIRQRDIELRQRDTELQLQAQWLEFMKVALNILEKYLSGK